MDARQDDGLTHLPVRKRVHRGLAQFDHEMMELHTPQAQSRQAALKRSMYLRRATRTKRVNVTHDTLKSTIFFSPPMDLSLLGQAVSSHTTPSTTPTTPTCMMKTPISQRTTFESNDASPTNIPSLKTKSSPSSILQPDNPVMALSERPLRKGDRVEVDWGPADDGPVYKGVIAKRVGRQFIYNILYDDNESRRENLNDRRWRHAENGAWVEPGDLAENQRIREDGDFDVHDGRHVWHTRKRRRKDVGNTAGDSVWLTLRIREGKNETLHTRTGRTTNRGRVTRQSVKSNNVDSDWLESEQEEELEEYMIVESEGSRSSVFVSDDSDDDRQ